MSKIILRVVGSVLFALLGLWLGYQFYIEPLFFTPEHVLADPNYIMSALFGGAIGFLLTLPVLWILKYAGKDRLAVKSFWFLPLMFSLLGGVANLTILETVIKLNGFIQCPAELGYKQNLLRNYVTDVSLCKRL
ncbi:hypothetical protein [Vibrio atlanticus]|uniref:Uncharacterized protein n=1 Tax=Vibrio atlanticus (strain LGP32) TaxID=575788 RepID=B7VRR6_VIBA3|nr:hypothetical protein [Vibrio atlanticus]CAV26311.1 hypothetical protein; putative membrane protein [Vibrio atlanticus]